MFYKAIVQSILLYACETWTIDSSMMKTLSGFHNRVARQIARKGPKRDPNTGVWEYPPLEEALQGAGLYPLEHYVAVRQGRFVDKIATRPVPILQLCTTVDRHSGSYRRFRWRNQTKLMEAYSPILFLSYSISSPIVVPSYRTSPARSMQKWRLLL